MAVVDLSTLVLGYSAQARPIYVVRSPGPLEAPRVLILAGQHGDETLAMEAVARLASAARHEPWADLEVSFVACLNPDGCARGTRETAEGRDLNRDHLFLTTPEARTVHEFARGFRPHLVIDVHTFKGRRRSMQALGGQHGSDVLLGWSNFSYEISDHGEALVSRAIEVLEQDGLRAAKYFVFDDRGRPRTSSTDILDARNGLAASVNALGILVEGREPTRELGDEARTLGALMSAVETLIQEWKAPTRSRRTDSRPATLATDLRRGPPRVLKSWILPRGAGEPLPADIQVLADVLHRREIGIPPGYFVPRVQPVEEILARHGYHPTDPPEDLDLELGRVMRAKASARRGEPWQRLRLSWERESLDPRPTHAYYSTHQRRGAHLARLLEPSSRYGLHRRPELGLPVVEGDRHAVYRIRESDASFAPATESLVSPRRAASAPPDDMATRSPKGTPS